MNRAVILQLYVLNIGGELSDVSCNHQAAWPLHGATDINLTGNGRVAGDLTLKISADQGVEVEMRELHGDLPRPQVAQTYRPINVQFGVFKIRAPAQLQVFAMGLRQDGHVAHRL